jgi:hypothetical protein
MKIYSSSELLLLSFKTLLLRIAAATKKPAEIHNPSPPIYRSDRSKVIITAKATPRIKGTFVSPLKRLHKFLIKTNPNPLATFPESPLEACIPPDTSSVVDAAVVAAVVTPVVIGGILDPPEVTPGLDTAVVTAGLDPAELVVTDPKGEVVIDPVESGKVVILVEVIWFVVRDPVEGIKLERLPEGSMPVVGVLLGIADISPVVGVFTVSSK